MVQIHFAPKQNSVRVICHQSRSEVAVQSQGARFGDEVLGHRHILAGLLAVSRFFDTSEWRFSCGGIT